jgi:tripeptidyl-peptidase-1
VTGYIEQFGQADDLREFLEEFRTDVDSSTTFETVSIAGGVNPQGDDVAGVEAVSPMPPPISLLISLTDVALLQNLDLQYTIGIAPGVPVQFVSVGKSGTGNGFLDTITTMIAQEEVPEVVTTSYGLDEDDVGADVAEYVPMLNEGNPDQYSR